MADERDEEETNYDWSDEIGASGLEQFGGIITEEFLHSLQGSQGVRAYREMADNCAVVGALLYLIESLVQQTPTKVDPADVDEALKPDAEDAADFLTSCLDDMSHTMQDFLCEVLTMLPFGWAYFEKILKTREGDNEDGSRKSRYNDGKIGIRKLALRAQSTLLNWKIDDDGGIRGMYQLAPPTYRTVFLPIEKCVLFRTKTNKNNPEGRSILRNAYRSYFYQKRMEELEAIGVERDCTGIPVMEVPPHMLDNAASAADKAKAVALRKLVQQIRRGQREGLLIPCEELPNGKKSGYKLRPYSGGGSRQFDVGEIIVRHEQRIAMVALGEFLLLGLDKVGSYSLVSSKTDLFAMALGTMLRKIESTFNRFVVWPLMKLNGYAQEVWPIFSFGDIETPPLDEVLRYISGMSDAGVLDVDDTLKRKIREMGGLPMPDAEEKPENETPPGPAAANSPDSPPGATTGNESGPGAPSPVRPPNG